MNDLLGELNVILITVWLFQKSEGLTVTSSTELLCGQIESHEAKSVEGYETVSD
jgi:hypothetical protein